MELLTVVVSGCKGLVSVRLRGSPLLADVQARACPRLQELRVDSRRLAGVDVSHCEQLQRLQIFALQQQDEGAAAADAVLLPRILTAHSERSLPPETQRQIRAVRALRRAASVGAA